MKKLLGIIWLWARYLGAVVMIGIAIVLSWPLTLLAIAWQSANSNAQGVREWLETVLLAAKLVEKQKQEERGPSKWEKRMAEAQEKRNRDRGEVI